MIGSEAKDASASELAITFCNSGILAADSATLLDLLTRITDDNASAEYYLTDVVAEARKAEGAERTRLFKEAQGEFNLEVEKSITKTFSNIFTPKDIPA